MNPTVIATVDAGRSSVVIWWTNIRAERTSSLARNCGAWELRKDDLEAIDAMTIDKVCLTTPTGRKFLETNFSVHRTYLDANSTLARVVAERQRLEMVLTSTNTRTVLKPLAWPKQPEPLAATKTKEVTAPKPVQRTLGIANWLVLVSEYWESIEGIRLSRPALRKLGDGQLRELPLVTESHPSKPTSSTQAGKRRAKKRDETPSLFDEPKAD